MPLRILATFAAGWKVSASANRHRRRPASSAPMVVLPLPATPATIRITGVTIRVRSSFCYLDSVLRRRPACVTWNVGSVIWSPAGLPYSRIRTTGLAGSIGLGNSLWLLSPDEGARSDAGEHQRQVQDRQVEQAHCDELVRAVGPIGVTRQVKQSVHLVQEQRS